MYRCAFMYPKILRSRKCTTAYLRQSGLGMPNKEYYLKTDERSEEIKAKYVAHIEKMFDLAGLENGKEAATTVMELETKLAEKQMDKEKTRDLVNIYTKVAVDSLSELVPDFKWDTYLREPELKMKNPSSC